MVVEAIEGVVYEDPVAIEVPPDGAVNQSKVPPVQPLAERATVPVLHRLAPVVEGAEGKGLTVAITELLALTHVLASVQLT